MHEGHLHTQVDYTSAPYSQYQPLTASTKTCRSAYASAKRTTDLFPKELTIVWDPLLEDKASDVNDVVELAVRLEDRLRAGEKVWVNIQLKLNLL